MGELVLFCIWITHRFLLRTLFVEGIKLKAIEADAMGEKCGVQQCLLSYLFASEAHIWV